jgi:DNA polymerase elongation subunit (family B)
MPRAYIESNAVIAISVVFAYAGSVPANLSTPEYVEYERHVFVLGRACEPIPGVLVHLFDDEYEMIAAVRDHLFVHKKVDIVAGHNLVRFDMEYMASRVALFGGDAARRFMRFGVLFMEALELQADSLNSSAYGSNRLSKLNGAGFAYVDTLLLCKQNYKLRQNTLACAAATFLKTVSKFDMPYALIPEVAAGTNGAHWRKLAAYCVQDSVLVLRLLGKWDTLKDLVAQSRVVNIPLATNVRCGQQVRVRDYMMKDARLHPFGMVMNGVNARVPRGVTPVDEGSAVGGFVMPTKPGFYNHPIVVLDFASLYPTVIDLENFCYSTVDLGDITPAHEAAGLKTKTFVTPTGTYKFVVNVPGVLPQALRTLKTVRNHHKSVMKAHPYGSAEYQNADAAQKATKIVMNSVYGVANCNYGIMPLKALGTSTCHVGRLLNIAAAEICRNKFGGDIVYGDTDSVFVMFPEPEHVKTASGKARLAYALAKGHEAENVINAHFKETCGTDVVKTECEKAYFPLVLSPAKKTYVGVYYAPGDEERVEEDLSPGCKSRGTITGRLECKGLRTVRRDVPQFIRELTEQSLDALMFKLDEDLFWDRVHTFAERLVRGELPIEAYVSTAELKDGYELQANVSAQAAVAYAKEYAVRGSAPAPGDRVEIVYVEEACAQRLERPSWMSEDIAKGQRLAARARSGGFKPSDDYVSDEEDAPSEAKRRRFVVLDDDTTNDKKSKHARSPEEVKANPSENHIDVMYYMDCVCALLKQLAHKEEGARAELCKFAQAYKEHSQRARGARFFGSGSSDPSTLPKLSHCRPVAPVMTKTRTLNGQMRDIADEGKSKSKPTGRKIVAAASKVQSSLAASIMKKKA